MLNQDMEKKRTKESIAFAERLNELLEKTGLTRAAFARAVGMSVPWVNMVAKGSCAPRLENLILVADYFAVPLDFLTGRCSQEEANAILKDYGRHFMMLRRAPYEAYLAGRPDGRNLFPQGTEEPWPYNLYSQVFGHPSKAILTRSQEEGIMQAIGLLTEKEQQAVCFYCRDGKSLRGTASEMGCSTENIRSTLAKAFRKMRTSAFASLILNGAIDAEAMERKAKELDELQKDLVAKREELEKETVKCVRRAVYFHDIFPEDPDKAPIDRLGLGARAYNSLKLAGINTVGEAIELSRSARFYTVRGIGAGTRNDISLAVKAYARKCLKSRELPDVKIEELSLSVSAYKRLKLAGIDDLEQLVCLILSGWEGKPKKIGAAGRRDIEEAVMDYASWNFRVPYTVTAKLVSVWDSGTAAQSLCRANLKARCVTDIEAPIEGPDIPDGEYLEIGGSRFTVSRDPGVKADFHLVPPCASEDAH